MTAPALVRRGRGIGFWKVAREVFPQTREQRCWFHKQANVLAALPKLAHPETIAAMREIVNAEDIGKAHPKAVTKLVDDADVLLEFYRYPVDITPAEPSTATPATTTTEVA